MQADEIIEKDVATDAVIYAPNAATTESKKIMLNGFEFDPDSMIAIVWSIEDVQHVRPHVTDDQAMDVLLEAKKHHDTDLGLTWETLRTIADDLFPIDADPEQRHTARPKRKLEVNIEQITKIEKQIARRLVSDAVKMGYTVAIDNDGYEYTLKGCTNITQIMAALMSTRIETIVFHDKTGQPVGLVKLVYGSNGYDVILEHTALGSTEAIFTRAEKLAKKIRGKFI